MARENLFFHTLYLYIHTHTQSIRVECAKSKMATNIGRTIIQVNNNVVGSRLSNGRSECFDLGHAPRTSGVSTVVCAWVSLWLLEFPHKRAAVAKSRVWSSRQSHISQRALCVLLQSVCVLLRSTLLLTSNSLTCFILKISLIY